MTTSFWDNLEIKKQFAGCSTLQDIISRLETDFSMRGEVICEIRVNGILLSEEDETRLATNSSSEIRDLSVRSNKPADLIVDALNSAYVFVPDLEASCLKTAEMFRSSDLNSAQKLFHECLEGCQWMVDTLMHVRGAASGIQRPISQPERWFEAEKVIGRAIRELSEAYSANDFVLVADLLEYELTGALVVWKATLTAERGVRSVGG
jgi:hypothetical protein